MFNFLGKSDSHIQEDVIKELKWEPSVTSAQINVATHDGVVTLRGSVPHYAEKTYAEEAVQRVGGVRAVVDELEVDIMGSYARSDLDIAEAVLHTIEWNYSSPKNLKVTVDSGIVSLKGEADWEFQRNAVTAAVKTLMGLRGINNNISIKKSSPQIGTQYLIEDALKRSSEKIDRRVAVDVNGGRVTLTGEVHSFAEMADARHAAWNASGVLVVENNFKIHH